MGSFIRKFIAQNIFDTIYSGFMVHVHVHGIGSIHATCTYMYNNYIPSSNLLFCGYEVIMMKPMV